MKRYFSVIISAILLVSNLFAVIPDSVANKPFDGRKPPMSQSSGTTVKVYGIDIGQNVSFQYPIGTTMQVWAGTLNGDLNGNAAKFYCIDISHYLATWSSSSPNEYTDDGPTNQYISYILNNYAPFTGTPTANQASAVQTAIWHFSDGVDVNTITNATVKALAMQIVNDAYANANSGSILSTLIFNPSNLVIPVGQNASFNLTAYKSTFQPMQGINVDFSATSGTLGFTSAVTDATGVISGITLAKGTSNNATVTATAHHIVPQGTRYIHKVSPDQYQKIVLATPVNAAIATNATVTWVESADLSISKTASSYSGNNGDVITFTITVTNHGPSPATGIKVTDVLPSGLNYTSHNASQGNYNTGTGVWSVGSLGNGASATLQMTTTVSLQSLNATYFTLGPAAGYNLFVLNDLFQPSSDTEGKVAVGHDAHLSGYSVGDKLNNAFGAEDVLVVGNDLTYVSGAVYGGNVVYGHSTNLPLNAVSINNGNLRQGSVIDFASASTYLLNLSNSLAGYPANGQTVFQWGGLELNGSHPLLNVFNVSGAQLSQANNMAINVPNGAVVLVNIDGANMTWRGGLTVTGTAISNVIYNFHQATGVTINLHNYTGGSGGSVGSGGSGGSGSGTGNWNSQGQFMDKEFIWALTSDNSGRLLLGTISGKIWRKTAAGFERINPAMTAGKYEVKFDASTLGTGVYIYRLEAGNFTNTRKMMLVK